MSLPEPTLSLKHLSRRCLSALLPLALLVPSGLYLFVLPYRGRRMREPSVREGDV